MNPIFIIENYEKFIKEWKLEKFPILSWYQLPKLIDQYIFENGTLYCSPCTPYVLHLFTNNEIWFQEGKEKELLEKLLKNYNGKVQFILQTPFGLLYSTRIYYIEMKTRNINGKDINYYIFRKSINTFNYYELL